MPKKNHVLPTVYELVFLMSSSLTLVLQSLFVTTSLDIKHGWLAVLQRLWQDDETND